MIETATLSESELSQYCREKGLYIEQIKSWKTQLLTGFQLSKAQQKEAAKQTKADQCLVNWGRFIDRYRDIS